MSDPPSAADLSDLDLPVPDGESFVRRAYHSGYFAYFYGQPSDTNPHTRRPNTEAGEIPPLVEAQRKAWDAGWGSAAEKRRTDAPQLPEEFHYDTGQYLRDEFDAHWRIAETLWNYDTDDSFPEDHREYVLVSVDRDTLGKRRRSREIELQHHYTEVAESEVREAIRQDSD